MFGAIGSLCRSWREPRDTFLIRIANEDNETGWITLHFQSLEDAREARAVLKTVIKVGARNM